MSRIDLPRVTSETVLKDRLADCAERGIEAINARLNELNCEWTAGRMVKAATGVVSMIGFVLAALLDPLWLLMPAIAVAFLLQYLFFRQSMLTELFLALGYRSGHDVDRERLMLRALRGDFVGLPTVDRVEDTDAVCRMEDEGGPVLPEPEEPKFGPREAATLILDAAK